MEKKSYVPPQISNILLPDICEVFGEDHSHQNDGELAKPSHGATMRMQEITMNLLTSLFAPGTRIDLVLVSAMGFAFAHGCSIAFLCG